MAGVAEGVAIAGLIVAAAGTTYGVVASNQQANYQADIENQNKKTALLAAADAIHRGDIAETAARTRTRLLISKQRAGFAAAGVELGSGSPASTTADTAMFGEMDALTIRNDAAREAWGYVAQSEDFKRRAALVKSAARNNQGATLLTGGSQQLNMYSAGLNSGVF
jgi:hypothetical protein